MQNARRTHHAANYGIYVEYNWHKMPAYCIIFTTTLKFSEVLLDFPKVKLSLTFFLDNAIFVSVIGIFFLNLSTLCNNNYNE